MHTHLSLVKVGAPGFSLVLERNSVLVSLDISKELTADIFASFVVLTITSIVFLVSRFISDGSSQSKCLRTQIVRAYYFNCMDFSLQRFDTEDKAFFLR